MPARAAPVSVAAAHSKAIKPRIFFIVLLVAFRPGL
jgi:hypothetical protein